MSDFEKVKHRILKVEGGYVNHPADPGGETKYGISKRSYPELDIKNLTEEQALDIYKRDWWDAKGYDKIIDTEVAYKMFEFSVNAGQATAVKAMQRAIAALGSKVKVDGKMGPITLAYINASVPYMLLPEFKDQMLSYYKGLVKAKPALKKFLAGWINRVES